MTLSYISTRGHQSPLSFQDAVMTGLARDGGLLVPSEVPDVSDRLAAWSSLDYPDLAFEVMRLFATDIPDADLRALVSAAYASFTHPDVAPVVPAGPVHVLELFHGPTLAFKDIALQFLGRLFAYILERRGGRLNILAATSGDTGSAAIAGVRGLPRVNIFVMHPHGRVSPLQERQMTSVLDPNVHNIAVEGSFDDCQSIMKALFNDLPFKDALSLGSVNSVNWARILAQIVYYFHAAFRVMERTGAPAVQFAVPTGNFGDILAGWYAKRMGLPITRLVLATNENDILARFFHTGVYARGTVVPTVNPSMDIQVASNFERWLYYRLGADPSATAAKMAEFAANGTMAVPRLPNGAVAADIVAGASDTRRTLATIKKYWEKHHVLLDPHTAAGVFVAEQYNDTDAPTICLATAHPAKFPAAIDEATGTPGLAVHPTLDALATLPTRCAVLPNDPSAVRDFLSSRAS
ncbi:MAG: threonine synthase [Kiritimatiellae bacterium]|nr:threonine synthase [Kiritimatiellia bacterium]